MTDTNKKPAYLVYTVIDKGPEHVHWLRIGSAWLHADSDGLNVVLDAFPVNGRLVLRAAQKD